MDLLNIITVLIIISAIFSYLNVRFIKLPGTIGVVTIAVVVSILILIVGKTSVGMANIFRNLAKNNNFPDVLLNVMLGFLLFASALHFDYKELKKQRLPVLLLSTLGVLVSTGVFAVLLFGLILFVIFLNIANGSGKELSAMVVFKLFVQEVAGGIIIGVVLGYIGYRMIRSIKDFQSILLISIALVLSISAVAHDLHASIPLAAVTAGLIIGTKTLDICVPGMHWPQQVIFFFVPRPVNL